MIRLLVAAGLSREDASTWAADHIDAAEDSGDDLLEEAVVLLVGIDQLQFEDDWSGPSGYLFDLDELEALLRRVSAEA